MGRERRDQIDHPVGREVIRFMEDVNGSVDREHLRLVGGDARLDRLAQGFDRAFREPLCHPKRALRKRELG